MSYRDKPVWLVSLIDKTVEEHLDDTDFDGHRFYIQWPEDGLYACPMIPSSPCPPQDRLD